MQEHLKNIFMQIQCDLEDHFVDKPKTHDGLIELLFADESMGWIKIEILQQYIEEFDAFPPLALVKLYSEDHPTKIFDHALFQRRKVDGATLVGPAKNFYLLTNGEKVGPFSETQINEKLRHRELLHTHTATNNDGKSWHKLFEFKSFDRRYLGQDDLPKLPYQELFHDSHHEAKGTLNQVSEEKLKKEAIAGLAHLGQIKSAKRPISEDHDEEHRLADNKTNEQGLGKIVAALLAVILVVGFWQWNSDKASKSTAKKRRKSSRVAKLKPIRKKTTSDRRNVQQSQNARPSYKTRRKKRGSRNIRSRSRSRRSISSKRGTSFSDNRKYRDTRKKMMDNPLRDEYDNEYPDTRGQDANSDTRKLSKEHYERGGGDFEDENDEESTNERFNNDNNFEEAHAEEEYLE